MEVAGGDLSPPLPSLLSLTVVSLRHVTDHVGGEVRKKKSVWFVVVSLF